MANPLETTFAGVAGIGGALSLVKGLNGLMNQHSDIKKAKVEILAGAVILLVASIKIAFDFGFMATSITKDIKAAEDAHSLHKAIFDKCANSTAWEMNILQLTSNFIYHLSGSVALYDIYEKQKVRRT